MGIPGLGRQSYVQWGYESPWNTAVPATVRNRIVSIRPRPEKGAIVSRAMNGSPVETAVYAGGLVGRVALEFELEYENMLGIFELVMGTDAYGAIGGVTTGSNPYVHTFKQRLQHNSATFQLIHGNIPAGKCHRITGAKAASAVFRGGSGLAAQPVSCVLELTGGNFETNVTPTGALSAPAVPLPVLMGHRTVMDDGTTDSAADIAMQNWELSIRNAFIDPRMDAANVLEPFADGFAVVEFKLNTEFQTRTALDHYLALTQGDPTIRFTSGTKYIDFDIPKAHIMNHDHDQEGPGRIFQNITWRAVSDGGTPPTGLIVTVQNANSAIAA